MANASFVQTDFRGGEWSPYAQGRMDDKIYRAAMNLCFNSYPIEAGAWVRRPGTRFCATTRYGQPAWLLPLFFAENKPYTLEFTTQILRLFNGPELVGTNDPQVVLSISSDNPAVVTIAADVPGSWSNGDMVYFVFNTGGGLEGAKTLFMRQFVIGSISGATFTLTDPISGAGIDGSTITLAANVAQVIHVQELASPYTVTQLTQINKVQAEATLVTLHPDVAPYALVQTTSPEAAAFAQFSYSAATFQDGPYMDPNTSGHITTSGLSGSVTLTSSASIFASTDVNRQIRLFSEPASWASGTAYSTGNIVKGPDGLYYQALSSSTGKQPDLNPTLWAVDPSAAIWTWATITAYSSGTVVTATINGPALLYSATNINTFRLGLYSDTTGYPTCGVWHEGRLWLAGAQGNRIDASQNGVTVPAGTFSFAPTASDGTVSDNNGISYVFNAEDVDEIFWLLPDNSGIVCGTQGGEWMVAASSLSDPLTPTSIQAHRRSKYKSAQVPAVHAGLSLLFVQAQGLKLMEYVADVFSGKFLGRNLSQNTKHLSDSGFAQIAYQQELNPVVWLRTESNGLVGTTYKRESSFTSEPPTFNGWHEHTLGSGRVVESISVGPSVNGNIESLTIVTNQTDADEPDFNVRHVEMLTDMFTENNIITDAWYLDDALTPSAAQESTDATSITFYGYYHLAGKTVSGWIGGIDAGDATVQSDGSVSFPINSGLLTDSYLNGLSTTKDFNGYGTYLDRTVNVKYPVGSGVTIQSYIATNSPDSFIDDYSNNRVFSIATGQLSTSSIASFNRLTGVKTAELTVSQIYSGQNLIDGWGVATSGGAILGPDGYIYCSVFSTNSSPIAKIDANTLKCVAGFGLSNSGSTNTNKAAIVIGDGVVVNVAGFNWLVYIGAAFHHLNVIEVDSMTWGGHDFAYTNGAIGICAGDSVNAGQQSYANVFSSASISTNVGLYRTTITYGAAAYNNPPTNTGTPAAETNGGISTTLIATITPADIDATWTGFTQVIGPLYDPVDGNVIMMFYNISGTTTKYIVKLNSQSGAVIWTSAVNWNGMNNRGMTRTKVQNGVLAFQAATLTAGHLRNEFIATASGSETNFDTTSLSLNTDGGGSEATPTDGSIVQLGQWSGATLTGVNGTTSFSNAVFKIQGMSGFPGDVTETKSIVIPAVIGFTYKSAGQLLRPEAPDATGARNGPGFAKTRRLHRYGFRLVNTQGLSCGTDPSKPLYPVKMQQADGITPYALNELFTGETTDVLQDDYSRDGMLYWEVTRPYPVNVIAAGGFIETMDR